MNKQINIPVFDAHHHLWDLDENYYPWLTDRITQRVCGEYSAIRKNYLIDDFKKDIAQVNVVKSIHVQAECSDPIAESRWLQKIANDNSSGGFPHGIVANVDFSKRDVEQTLEKQVSFKNVIGIRQMLHEGQIDYTKPSKSHLENPLWIKQFGLLKQFNLTFDLQIYYQQLQEAEKLLNLYPNIQFVLCHTGQPARRDEEGIYGWKQAIKRLSRFSNLVVKISGCGMFDRTWTVESIRPFIEFTIDTFGVERCLFGSNFPVDGMMTDYTRLWKAYDTITSLYSSNEREKLFYKNADRIYLKNI
jgi:predicted TIM-barrel fold metal-dependent hydrolase